MGLDECREAVRDFHLIFGHPIGPRPRLLPPDREAARSAWMREEIRELEAAETVSGQADAMVDLIYFALGTLVEMGVRSEGLFDIVHAANMEKLWPDGTGRMRSDGKTVKPPGWADPLCETEDEVARQDREKEPELRTPYHYRPIRAKPYLCLPAVLATVIEAESRQRVSQEEVAERLGGNTPPNANPPVSNASTTENRKRWGTVLESGTVDKLFVDLGIALREEYVGIAALQDWQFEELLEERLRAGAHVACGYSHHALTGKGHPDVGHASIILSLLPGRCVVLLNPGPEDFGMREADPMALYAAIRFRHAGVWIFHPTDKRLKPGG